jgi:CxxC motif-containing protein (DUF1111 family)
MGIKNQRTNRYCLAVATFLGGTLGLSAAGFAGDDSPTPQPAIGAPIDGLNRTELDRFSAGKTLYGTPLLIEDGLGPVLNKSNCRSCHSNPDGGPGNILVNHFGMVEKGEFTPLPGGTLLQLVAISSGCEETLPPEANFTTNRVTPGMLGYGLVEAISDADIVANEDPNDANSDGISGRVHWVPTFGTDDPGELRAGRFGWKSIVANVITFSGDAALNEMGLTNQIFGEETAPNGDLERLALCDDVADPEDHPDRQGFTFVDRVTQFQRYLAPPPQAPRSGMSGETVFNTFGCNACHTQSFTTGTLTTDGLPLESALENKVVKPYSDFLLHDMGLLGDNLPQGDATGNEFRTTPLMGVARRLSMLHDGRVNSGPIESRLHQAISLHGPFGEGANAAAAYLDATKDDQYALIEFLKSLGRTDFDQDEDDLITLQDFETLLACSKIDAVISPDDACGISDVNQDGLINLADLGSFLLAYEGVNGDCDDDGVTDLEEIFLGATDEDGNGIPDECVACPGDFNENGVVDGGDLGLMLVAWGSCTGCPEDLNADGNVNGADLGLMLVAWGVCP